MCGKEEANWNSHRILNRSNDLRWCFVRILTSCPELQSRSYIWSIQIPSAAVLCCGFLWVLPWTVTQYLCVRLWLLLMVVLCGVHNWIYAFSKCFKLLSTQTFVWISVLSKYLVCLLSSNSCDIYMFMSRKKYLRMKVTGIKGEGSKPQVLVCIILCYLSRTLLKKENQASLC